MSKPLPSAEILPFPPSAAEPAALTTYNSAAAKMKAHNAFHAAKQRCQNPNNPSYAGYGGAGIKFLLVSVDQLVQLAGLPKQHQSLDRINPKGHYEPGNVRWANKQAQAQNKKKSKGGAVPVLADLVAQYEAEAAAVDRRATALAAWERMLQAYRRGYFVTADADWFAVAGLPAELFSAGWEFGQFRDWAKAPSYFHMPSITWPGRLIRVRGGPFSSPEGHNCYGTFQELVGSSAAMLPPPLGKWINEGLEAPGKHGSVWIGQVTESMLRAGGVEGVMWTAASRLRGRLENPVNAAFYPALELLRVLDELGGPWKWKETSHPVLDAKALFVPDLQIDVGGDGHISTKAANQYAQLLEYRRDWGWRTFVGVQNPHKLPTKLAYEVLGQLIPHEVDPYDWPPIVPASLPVPTGEQVTLKTGRLGFAGMKAAVK